MISDVNRAMEVVKQGILETEVGINMKQGSQGMPLWERNDRKGVWAKRQSGEERSGRRERPVQRSWGWKEFLCWSPGRRWAHRLSPGSPQRISQTTPKSGGFQWQHETSLAHFLCSPMSHKSLHTKASRGLDYQSFWGLDYIIPCAGKNPGRPCCARWDLMQILPPS